MKTIIQKFIPQTKHWVGDGFHVYGMFSVHSTDPALTSPFLLLDYADPTIFEPTETQRGVGEHPHRGFETVTFALKGEVEHRDSSGGGGTIAEGDVQWMTAGGGIVHEEFHSKKFSETGGEFSMIQLWVNLPTLHKRTPPQYQALKAGSFPSVELTKNATMKIFCGAYNGQHGPATTFTPINIFEINCTGESDFSLELCSGSTTLVMALDSQVGFGKNESINQNEIAVMSNEETSLNIKTYNQNRLMIFNGQPIHEQVVAHGPFVMNTKQEISEAIEDFQNGKMGRL
jgi:quercetin 2,3-dioxygenase